MEEGSNLGFRGGASSPGCWAMSGRIRNLGNVWKVELALYAAPPKVPRN